MTNSGLQEIKEGNEGKDLLNLLGVALEDADAAVKPTIEAKNAEISQKKAELEAAKKILDRKASVTSALSADPDNNLRLTKYNETGLKTFEQMKVAFEEGISFIKQELGEEVLTNNTDLNEAYILLTEIFSTINTRLVSLPQDAREQFVETAIFSKPNVLDKLSDLINKFISELAKVSRSIKRDTESGIEDVNREIDSVGKEIPYKTRIEIDTESQLAQIEAKFKANNREKIPRLSPEEAKAAERKAVLEFVSNSSDYKYRQINIYLKTPQSNKAEISEFYDSDLYQEALKEYLGSQKTSIRVDETPYINHLRVDDISKSINYLDDKNFERFKTSIRDLGLTPEQQIQIYSAIPTIDNIAFFAHYRNPHKYLSNYLRDVNLKVEQKNTIVQALSLYLLVKFFIEYFTSNDLRIGDDTQVGHRSNKDRSDIIKYFNMLLEAAPPNAVAEFCADFSVVMNFMKRSGKFNELGRINKFGSIYYVRFDDTGNFYFTTDRVTGQRLYSQSQDKFEAFNPESAVDLEHVVASLRAAESKLQAINYSLEAERIQALVDAEAAKTELVTVQQSFNSQITEATSTNDQLRTREQNLTTEIAALRVQAKNDQNKLAELENELARKRTLFASVETERIKELQKIKALEYKVARIKGLLDNAKSVFGAVTVRVDEVRRILES